jgi:hypothetical protein
VQQNIRRNNIQIENLDKVAVPAYSGFSRFKLAWAVIGVAAFLFISLGLHLGDRSTATRNSVVAVASSELAGKAVEVAVTDVTTPVVARINDASELLVCRSNTSTWTKMNGELALRLGDRVKSGPASDVILYYEGRGRLTLKPDTDLQVIASGVRIRKGTTWFKITKRGLGFYAETPNAVAAVRGTIYTVEVSPSFPSETTVNVFRGAVEVYPGTVNRPTAESVLLTKGETVEVTGQLLHTKELVAVEEYNRFGMEIPEELANVDVSAEPVDAVSVDTAGTPVADYSVDGEPNNNDLPVRLLDEEAKKAAVVESGPASSAAGRPR